jgi:hypothetical protein
MPNLTCPCGESISLSPIPNPQGFKILAESVLEDLVERLVDSCTDDVSKPEFEKRAYQTLHVSTPGILQAYECPNCRRLAVFSRASDSVPALWFQREQVSKEPSLTKVAGDSIARAKTTSK